MSFSICVSFRMYLLLCVSFFYMCFFLYLFLYVSFFICVFFYMCLFLYVSFFIYVFLCVCVSFYVYLFLCVSLCVCVSLSLSLSLSLCVCLPYLALHYTKPHSRRRLSEQEQSAVRVKFVARTARRCRGRNSDWDLNGDPSGHDRLHSNGIKAHITATISFILRNHSVHWLSS